MKKILVLFSGGASALKYLYEHDTSYGVAYKVVAGISNKKGTGGEVFCKEHAIPFIECNTKQFCIANGYTGLLKDMPSYIRIGYFNTLLEIIKQYKPDIILLSGFMLSMRGSILYYRPIINVHPADLRILNGNGKPKYTGDDAVTMAIAAGETYTASTIHFVEEEVDCGEIICVSNPLAVEDSVSPKEHQEKMKLWCDGPAYKQALEILCKQ